MIQSDYILRAFRQAMADDVEPHFWAAEEVYRFLTESYFDFVRAIGGIEVVGGPSASLPIVAGQSYTEFPKEILRITGAWLSSTEARLKILNHPDPFEKKRGDWGLYQSDPECIYIGLIENRIYLKPTPLEDDTLILSAYRLPLEIIKREKQEVEVEEWHLNTLLEGMKAQAYARPDSDSYDPNMAKEARQRYMEGCEKARAERERREWKPRTVLYGGL